MATPGAQEECIRKANALRLPTLRNLLTCSGMASRNGVPQIPLPRRHCRIYGSVPIFWHKEKCAARETVLEIERVKVQYGLLTPNRARFRVCEFSVGEWIVSF